MSYNLEACDTNYQNSLVEELTKKNSIGLQEMRTNRMPVMVPIQEKDWDTMVSLLQEAVNFQPEIYRLQQTLLTTSGMKEMMRNWSITEQKTFNQSLNMMESKLAYQQTAVENLLHRMESNIEQAGKNLENIMSNTLDKGLQLEAAIAKASVKTDRRTWLIRTAISVGATVMSATLSSLLWVHFLV